MLRPSMLRSGTVQNPSPASLPTPSSSSNLRRPFSTTSPLKQQHRCRQARCSAELRDSTATSSISSSPTQRDPFVAAALRLQSLIENIGDGEEEVVKAVMAGEDPYMKIQAQIAFGGIVTIAAVIITSLCGQDPWGGASLSLHSLAAAAVGAMAAAPLVAMREWTWSPSASRMIPALEEVHVAQLETAKPWLSGMTQEQVAIMMFVEVLPITMMLYPAAQAGLTLAIGKYSEVLTSWFHYEFPENSTAVTALVITAVVAAVGRAFELGVSPEEFEVVETASTNADRYYRVMLNGPAEASTAAIAFRAVAQAWAQNKAETCSTGAAIALADVSCFGVLWYLTDDLTAPVVAALLLNWVDYWHMHQRVLTQEKMVKQRNPNSRR